MHHFQHTEYIILTFFIVKDFYGISQKKFKFLEYILSKISWRSPYINILKEVSKMSESLQTFPNTFKDFPNLLHIWKISKRFKYFWNTFQSIQKFIIALNEHFSVLRIIYFCTE